MIEFDDRDDPVLLAATGDDGAAFSVFYRRHLDVVLRLCARRGLDASEAADVTAETFAAAFLARNRYRPQSGPARAWLLGIAAHKLADHQRQAIRTQRALRRLAVDPIELSERDAVDYAEILAQESESTATDALSALPDAQRFAVRARVIEGESYGAISRRLDISESAARQRVSRGLTALRTKLGKEQP